MPSRTQELRAAAKRFKRFQGRAPNRVTAIELPYPKALVYLGRAIAIEYESDKVLKAGDRRQPRQRVYRHELGPGVKIYADPKGRTVFMRGGRFRVTDWMRD
jgi:hypothetical protein